MFFHFVWQHFLQHFAFFSCDLLVEKHRNDLFGFNGFYAVQGDALRPDVAYLDFFLLFPPHRGQSRTSAFFFPRTFLSDCYWSSLIGADIGLLSGEHADIHGHSRTFITMSSVSLPFAFPQWKNVKNQELYGKNNSAADLYHAARSAHKSTTALSKSLLWYLPTNAIQRLTKKQKILICS